jgi:hypothetical protein
MLVTRFRPQSLAHNRRFTSRDMQVTARSAQVATEAL